MGAGAGHEMGPMGNGLNHPPATEYTLQGQSWHRLVAVQHGDGMRAWTANCAAIIGVMRFLQTEWHRHERDRNAWEIERQEMKSRIASLEGQTRRADATQKALKKYVTILEKKVKDQAALLKGGDALVATAEKSKLDRAALLQEKLRCMWCSLYHSSSQLLAIPPLTVPCI